jgi:hypothetical protein
MLGTLESELLKVTALNLFHPTVSTPFQKDNFFYIVLFALPFIALLAVH